jgi:glycine/D-amino acid oxidase-like deaminating enzyme
MAPPGERTRSAPHGTLQPPPPSPMPTPLACVAGDASVVVIGGGVIGLSTALHLLRGGFRRVVVVGDVWTPHTTSDGAGAFWERHYDGHAAWARETMKHYQSLVAAGRGAEAGVSCCVHAHAARPSVSPTPSLPPPSPPAHPLVLCGAAQVGFIDGYQFQHDVEAFAFQHDVPRFRLATATEIAAASARTGQRYRSGCYWRSVIADSPTYLMWLMREVTAAGGVLVRRQVTALAELAPFFDIIVNCAGLGARDLVGDASMVAIRGQLIRVYAPQVKRFITNSAGGGGVANGGPRCPPAGHAPAPRPCRFSAHATPPLSSFSPRPACRRPRFRVARGLRAAAPHQRGGHPGRHV